MGFFHKIGSSINNIGKGTKKGLSSVGKWFKKAGDDIGDVVSDVYGDVKGLVTDTTHFIKDSTNQILSPTTLLIIGGVVIAVVLLQSQSRQS